jgi:hypothetical protein
MREARMIASEFGDCIDDRVQDGVGDREYSAVRVIFIANMAPSASGVEMLSESDVLCLRASLSPRPMAQDPRYRGTKTLSRVGYDQK